MRRRTEEVKVSLLMFVRESLRASPQRPSATIIPLSIFISRSLSSLLALLWLLPLFLSREKLAP